VPHCHSPELSISISCNSFHALRILGSTAIPQHLPFR
jgi:hypothetical protein